MRRALVPLALLLAVLPAAPAAAGHSAVRTRAALVACTTGATPEFREATFEASMPRRPGASVLELRFSLQRFTSRRWSRIVVRAFEVPERSRAGAAGLVHETSIDGLAGPGRYRASVRFTWRTADGEVVARTYRRTASCRQPDWRPDLRVAGLGYSDGRYVVAVENLGRGPAGPTEVVLGLAGANRPPVAVGGLRAAEQTEVEVPAPACRPGELVRVTVDAGGALAERHEDDNTVDLPCPGA